jgi:hypothetical protein
LYYELLENNAGCRLPCWWGIIPGQTKGIEAQRFLETFTLVRVSEGTHGVLNLDARIPLPKEYGTVSHFYLIKEVFVIEKWEASHLTLFCIIQRKGYLWNIVEVM